MSQHYWIGWWSKSWCGEKYQVRVWDYLLREEPTMMSIWRATYRWVWIWSCKALTINSGKKSNIYKEIRKVIGMVLTRESVWKASRERDSHCLYWAIKDIYEGEMTSVRTHGGVARYPNRYRTAPRVNFKPLYFTLGLGYIHRAYSRANTALHAASACK